MNTRHFTFALLAVGIATALAAVPALAQTSGTTTTSTTTVSTTTTTTNRDATRLSTEFSLLAGSDANAQALVNGLRDGSAITLTTTVPGTNGAPATTTTTTFTPDTGKMGYGNVKIALSLAEASLAKAGITDPTAAELEAALNGGKLVMTDGSTVDLKGVLAARASGEGWGQIAKDMGFKLGDVMRAPKHAGELAEHGHRDHDKVARVELAQGHGHDMDNRPARAERLSKVDRPERPDRPEHPDHPDHPDHVGRPGG
jgi:hypothetical protein